MQLVEPSQDFRAPFLELAQEWLDAGSQRYAGALLSFERYLVYLRQSRCDVGVLEERVPCAHYWLEDAGKIVACLRLRYRLTPALALEGGHIGYDVRPSLRRRGYGTRLLRLGLEQARSAGIDPVCVTTDSDNVGSIRVIERNGGQLAGESRSLLRGVPIRQYWIWLLPCRVRSCGARAVALELWRSSCGARAVARAVAASHGSGSCRSWVTLDRASNNRAAAKISGTRSCASLFAAAARACLR